MAACAIGAQTLEDTGRRAAMAGITGNCGVRAKQRKPVLVILDVAHGNSPASHGVAVLACFAKLVAMNVGVTIGALLAYLAENSVDVTLAARHVFMQAPQWELGLGVVIKFRLRTDRPPTDRGVAAFAGNGQRTVWIPSVLSCGRLSTCQPSPGNEPGHPAGRSICQRSSPHSVPSRDCT